MARSLKPQIEAQAVGQGCTSHRTVWWAQYTEQVGYWRPMHGRVEGAHDQVGQITSHTGQVQQGALQGTVGAQPEPAPLKGDVYYTLVAIHKHPTKRDKAS